MKTSRLPPTRTSRDQRSQGKRRCGARPGRTAGSERVSRASFLPASLESLLGGAGTAVCYPTLEKTLQGAGRELKAFSIIQQSSFLLLLLEPGEGWLEPLGWVWLTWGEGWLSEGQQPSRPTSARPPCSSAVCGVGRRGQLCLAGRLGAVSCPADSDCAVEWRQRVGEVPRAKVGCPREAREEGHACCLQERAGQLSWHLCPGQPVQPPCISDSQRATSSCGTSSSRIVILVSDKTKALGAVMWRGVSRLSRGGWRAGGGARVWGWADCVR